jgi:signal transduction histidine kinase
LDKLAKDNPKLTTKVKEAKTTAQKSQTKVKQLITAIHGQDNYDDDLESALKSAKTALSDLKRYLSK